MRFKPGLPNAAALAARLGCVLLGCALLLIGQSPRDARPPARRPGPTPSAAAAPDAIVPFRGGERLAFHVLWSKYSVKAAALEFSVVERRNFFGRLAWHFRALAQTTDTVRALYPLDDQFDSYTDAAQLTSLQYEMYLREQGQRQDNVWRMDSGQAPAPSGVTAARVLPGTRDPLGLLYALRAADWKETPEFRAPVFDGRRIYDVRARAEEVSSDVKVPAGQFTASRISVRVFEGGRELADTKFVLWLTADTNRTPVLIEAEVPIGSARVELTSQP